MNSLRLILLPFLVGIGAARLLLELLPPAAALECVGDEYRVIEQVHIEGAPIEFPQAGHLYADELDLWDEGQHVTLEYAP